jgi:hypothetical protein
LEEQEESDRTFLEYIKRQNSIEVLRAEPEYSREHNILEQRTNEKGLILLEEARTDFYNNADFLNNSHAERELKKGEPDNILENSEFYEVKSPGSNAESDLGGGLLLGIRL